MVALLAHPVRIIFLYTHGYRQGCRVLCGVVINRSLEFRVRGVHCMLFAKLPSST